MKFKINSENKKDPNKNWQNMCTNHSKVQEFENQRKIPLSLPNENNSYKTGLMCYGLDLIPWCTEIFFQYIDIHVMHI